MEDQEEMGAEYCAPEPEYDACYGEETAWLGGDAEQTVAMDFGDGYGYSSDEAGTCTDNGEPTYAIDRPEPEMEIVPSFEPLMPIFYEDTSNQEAYDATRTHGTENYDTIAERSDYYASIDEIMESNEGTKDVHFFEAASEVTGTFGVGVIETPFEFFADHSDAAKDMLLSINAGLLDENMNVIDNLLQKGVPTDPNNPGSTEKMSGLEFDLAMVQFEQGNVQKMLDDYQTTHSESDYQDAVEDINGDLNFDGAVRTVGRIFADNQPTDWATEALGQERLDFTDLEDRKAIGMAKVYAEHGKSEEEFREYWQEHQRSQPEKGNQQSGQ